MQSYMHRRTSILGPHKHRTCTHSHLERVVVVVCMYGDMRNVRQSTTYTRLFDAHTMRVRVCNVIMCVTHIVTVAPPA
jgi:hypothetical protein